MKKQITHISVHQSSKVIALLHTFISFFFIGIPFLLINVGEHHVGLGIMALILIPFFYFIFSYIVLAVVFYFYNWVVKYAGGVELEVEDLMTVKKVDTQ